MRYSLHPLSSSALKTIEAGLIPEELSTQALPDAMPPDFVASRALQLETEPDAQPIPTSYLIVRNEDSRFVGACGFKTALGVRRVEVGYGVASSASNPVNMRFLAHFLFLPPNLPSIKKSPAIKLVVSLVD